MSSASEKGTENRHGIGEHVAPNRGPRLKFRPADNHSRWSVKTALDVDDANGRGANVGKG
jgi:hypothetical protein